jgi:platelet-activating factor acetylhydrolase
MLLDVWVLPTLAKQTHKLFKKPLPQVATGNGDKVLVIMSDEFHRWRENLRGVRRLISDDPGRRRGGEEHKIFEQWPSDSEASDSEEEKGDDDETPAHKHLRLNMIKARKQRKELERKNTFLPSRDVPTPANAPTVSPFEQDGLKADDQNQGHQIIAPSTTPSPPPSTYDISRTEKRKPRFYYVEKSMHLSQSDFGLLFPRVAKKAEDPEKILDINIRAAIQWLREASRRTLHGG